ncbi:MAG TPA: D-glycerate dehydrogenase [Trueperaceae bacterium]
MAQSPLVFISRRLPTSCLELLERAGCRLRVHDSEVAPSRHELLEGVAGCDAVITLVSDRVDEEFLDKAGERLRVVANYAVGYDNVDVGACSRRGVLVTNTPDVLTEATADQAFMLILAVARRALEGHRLVASGLWQGWHPLQLLGQDVSGATLGIVGMGRIGAAVARRAGAFGMKVLYHNRSRRPEAERQLDASFRPELPALLEESDIVSLHAPLTTETRHLIDAAALALMRRHAILVNTSRGPLVDEVALLEALREGQIWGAGLDVFEDEPRVTPGLAELDNVLLAPHLGSATERTRREMAGLCARAVIAVLAGELPPNVVDE